MADRRNSFTEPWRAGREAVARFSLFCTEHGWNFVEVPQQCDFGKDGYVDVPGPAGQLVGNCFAVQVKGGRSRWRTHGYTIEATQEQRERWAFSTMPVIGIAIDPNDGSIYWCDLSAALRQNDVDTKLRVPRDNRLDDPAGLKRFLRYCASMTQSGHAMLDLISSDPDRQADAAFVCCFVGREDGRALVLLRRLLFTLHPDVLACATEELSYAIPHADHLHSSDTMVSPGARATLRESLDWTPGEVRQLLSLVEHESGFGRGSMGQTVFHLLVEGKDHEEMIRRATVGAARDGDFDVASWGLVLAVYLAGEEGAATLESLLAEAPELGSVWSAGQIASDLAAHGAIEI